MLEGIPNVNPCFAEYYKKKKVELTWRLEDLNLEMAELMIEGGHHLIGKGMALKQMLQTNENPAMLPAFLEAQAVDARHKQSLQPINERMQAIQEEIKDIEEYLALDEYQAYLEFLEDYEDEKSMAMAKTPADDAVPAYGKIKAGYTVFYLGPKPKGNYEHYLKAYVLDASSVCPDRFWIWCGPNCWSIVPWSWLEAMPVVKSERVSA